MVLPQMVNGRAGRDILGYLGNSIGAGPGSSIDTGTDFDNTRKTGSAFGNTDMTVVGLDSSHSSRRACCSRSRIGTVPSSTRSFGWTIGNSSNIGRLRFGSRTPTNKQGGQCKNTPCPSESEG